MRNKVFVRPARAEDAEQFLEWSRANQKNGFDPEVPRYPSTVTWVAYDRFGPLAYMPMQCPLMMESLASRPGASKSEIAVALKELTQQIVTQAHQRGAGEIYFLGTDVDTDVMACNQIFERVDYPVYRVRLKDLENQP